MTNEQLPHNRLTMHMLRDGIISGAIERTKQECGICGTWTMVIWITTVDLPQGIKVESTILTQTTSTTRPQGRTVGLIGVGCGCYARFHRQIAHIEDMMKARAR